MRLIDADRLKSYIDCGHLRPPTEVCFSELDVCNMIDKAPTVSAEAVQRWIPVSEMLPDKTGWYVVTVAGLETITDMLVFYNEVSAWSDITDKQKVVAWMPLPEPYKGGEDE